MTSELFEAIKAKSNPTPVQEQYWQRQWPNGADRALATVKEQLRHEYLGWVYDEFKGHHILCVVTQLGCAIGSHEGSLRKSLDALSWQFVTTGSRWHHLLPRERQHDCFGLAAVEPLEPLVVYHATERERWPRILEKGLLPSNPTIATSGFPDTEGRIHVCAHHDNGREGATYWVTLLSERRKRKDDDYIIIEVDLHRVPGARVYQDVHSTSGLVVDRIESIPAAALRLV
jgi:hypothetical protein